MNKLVCGILTVILCLSAVGALAQESDLPEVRCIADGDPVQVCDAGQRRQHAGEGF